MLVQDGGEDFWHVDIDPQEGRELIIRLRIKTRVKTREIPEHLIRLGREQDEMTDVVVEQFQHVLGEVRVSLEFREALGVIGLQLLVGLLVRGEIGHRIRQPALAMSVFEDVFDVFPEVIIPMLQDITEIGTVTLH